VNVATDISSVSAEQSSANVGNDQEPSANVGNGQEPATIDGALEAQDFKQAVDAIIDEKSTQE